MKLSDIKGEEAFEVLADLTEPASKIFSDEKLRDAFGKIDTDNAIKFKIIRYILKSYQKEIIEILAILDRIPVEEYEFNVFTLPKKIMEILSDEDLITFFSQYLTETEEPIFGNVTGNIKENQ